MTPASRPFITLLYAALSQPHGLSVQLTPDTPPALLKSRLLSARTECEDPALDALSIRPSLLHPTTELWIIRKPAPHGVQGTDMDA